MERNNPPSLGFVVLLAARVRLFEELVEVFILICWARVPMGVLMAAGVPAVAVAHNYKGVKVGAHKDVGKPRILMETAEPVSVLG